MRGVMLWSCYVQWAACALLVAPAFASMRVATSARGYMQALFGVGNFEGNAESPFGGEPGLLSLNDGRQIYVDCNGWVQAHKPGELGEDVRLGYVHNVNPGDASNTNPARRIWNYSEGTLSLLDGRQLYVNKGGWLGVAQEGEHTNTDTARRIWTWKRGVLSLEDGRQVGQSVRQAGRQSSTQSFK